MRQQYTLQVGLRQDSGLQPTAVAFAGSHPVCVHLGPSGAVLNILKGTRFTLNPSLRKLELLQNAVRLLKQEKGHEGLLASVAQLSYNRLSLTHAN